MNTEGLGVYTNAHFCEKSCHYKVDLCLDSADVITWWLVPN